MKDLGYNGQLTASMQCKDLDAAIAWYRDILGMELIYKKDEMGWCELKSSVANVNVGLSQVDSPDVKGGATLTWGVNDIANARQTLEAQKVPFDGETMTIPGMVSLATFFDPDGNKHMLFQDLQSGA